MDIQSLLIDKQLNPEKYIKVKLLSPWPYEYMGSLLSWLSSAMIEASFGHRNHKPSDIDYVYCYKGENDVKAYEFDIHAFDIDFLT